MHSPPLPARGSIRWKRCTVPLTLSMNFYMMGEACQQINAWRRRKIKTSLFVVDSISFPRIFSVRIHWVRIVSSPVRMMLPCQRFCGVGASNCACCQYNLDCQFHRPPARPACNLWWLAATEFRRHFASDDYQQRWSTSYSQILFQIRPGWLQNLENVTYCYLV